MLIHKWRRNKICFSVIDIRVKELQLLYNQVVKFFCIIDVKNLGLKLQTRNKLYVLQDLFESDGAILAILDNISVKI